MSAFKNDGSVVANTRVLTIGSAAGGTGGTTYVAEQFSPNRPAKVIERTDENDEPNGQVAYKSFVTGTATLQLASSSTAIPLQGWEFTETLDATTGAEIFFIFEVGIPQGQGAEKKVNVTFRKKYN